MKKTIRVFQSPPSHWVGDGFPVRGMFGNLAFSEAVSPFLMLDYAGPHTFEPTTGRRGVDAHPHKGFETVTIVYDGEVEHHDSTGNHGVIGPGDVQWMTAGAGILHKEYHSENFARNGGPFEMVQLWVNLPARDKETPPGYQTIFDKNILAVPLDGGGVARLIAGSLCEQNGPAKTMTPMNVWDLTFENAGSPEMDIPPGHTTLLLVLKGKVEVPDGSVLGGVSLGIFDSDDPRLAFTATAGTRALLLTGQPLGEPIAAEGPFVMNSREELRKAMIQFQKGGMGRL